MPIYEYRCGACGLQKEFLQRLSDAPLRDCPECGKPELGKLISAAGFHLKGTGWYATDFKNNGSKPTAKAKQDDKPAANAKQDKPAASSGSDGPKTDSSKAEAGASAGTGPA